MKSLLVLAAGPLQLPAVTTAKRMGLRVVVADGDSSAPGLALADAPHVIDIRDAELCLSVARKEKIDGVIQICSEVSIFAMGRINEELGLHGIDSATAIRATNKEKMRRAFEAGGAPSPQSIGAATLEEALMAREKIGNSLIVKPSRNSGSRGVSRVVARDSRDRFIECFHRAMSESRDRSVVIEDFIEGPEFSIEILTWNGRSHVLTVTDKTTTGDPLFVETGHCEPSRETPENQRKIVDAALAGVKALGIDWAAAHAEIKLSERGPFLMEIGARLGGDFITTELVPRSTGIDMVEGAIRLALGEEPDLRPRHAPQGACIRYFTPPPGKVVEVSGVAEVLQMPGVKIVDLHLRAGDTVPEVTSSLARVGHVIAEGRTADEAVVRAEQARDRIVIKTEKS